MDTAQHILNLPLAEGREASSKSWGRKWGYSRQHCGGPTEPKSSKEHQPLWSQRHRGDRTLVWYSLTCWWTLLQNDMVLWEAPRMAAEGEEANSLPALTGSIIAPPPLQLSSLPSSPHHPHHHHSHHHTILITTIPITTTIPVMVITPVTPSSPSLSTSPPLQSPSLPTSPSSHHPHHCHQRRLGQPHAVGGGHHLPAGR